MNRPSSDGRPTAPEPHSTVSFNTLHRMQSWGKAPPPTVLFDLSPIVMLAGAPDWLWVEICARAWREQRDPTAQIYGVADNSLFYRLDETGRRGLSEWKRKRMARSVSWADPEVLELATLFPDAAILTTDLFRDHRRDFGWLQGTDRIWRPSAQDGSVSFERLDFSPIPDDEVSWRIEEADLTPKGITSPEAREALKYEWVCANPACHWAVKSVIEEDPAFRQGQVVCPACFAPVSRQGFRDITREVVLLLEDDEVDRIPIADGSTLTVGRGRDSGRYDVRDVLGEDAASRISRDHIRLVNRSGRIFAEDLGSKNGTSVVRGDGKVGQLQGGVQQALAPGERLELAGGVLTLRLSGKRRPRGVYAPDLITPPFLRTEGHQQ